MTDVAALYDERFHPAQVTNEQGPRNVFGVANRCETPDCTRRATTELSFGDSRTRACGRHTSSALLAIAPARGGAVHVKRLDTT